MNKQIIYILTLVVFILIFINLFEFNSHLQIFTINIDQRIIVACLLGYTFIIIYIIHFLYRKTQNTLIEKSHELEIINNQIRANQVQLAQTEKMVALGQLCAGVAHEVNNPIGFISSNLNTLKEYTEVFIALMSLYDKIHIELKSIENNDAIMDAFKEIEIFKEQEDLNFIMRDLNDLIDESKEGATHIKDIVQSLKTFARMDENEYKLTDINECIDSTLKIVSSEIKYMCNIEKKLDDLPQIECYPSQLCQVFLNLFMNAAHAIEENGKITIKTLHEQDYIYIYVKDTGKGISEENLVKIFDPFFTTKPEGMGTGLGLSIAHGIIKKHNGSLDVKSKVGKGTTFSIKLPLHGITNLTA